MKNSMITGGNSGIGFAAAVQIAEKGYAVTIVCRNEQRAKKACNDIIQKTGNLAVDYLIADLSDMSAVREVADSYMQKHDTLDVLINNAADFDLSVKQPIITADGMERQFATNVAAPFLLAKVLFPALKKSDYGRMINISSQGLCVYPFIKLDFGNLNGERSYSPSKTYYQNKLALLMWSLYIANQQKDIKIQAIRVTNVKIDMSRYDNINPFLKHMYKVKSKFSISPEEMAKVYATDTLWGGYYENLEKDWSHSPAGAYAGDRKSLDIHMHLLETFTTLYKASGKEIHARKLQEVMDLIFKYMVNCEKGYGYNQFDISFHQLPAINIKRTWNAERETNETIAEPTDTTSYGHNVELSWLADLALQTLKCDRSTYEDTLRKLLDHAIQYGLDPQYGGVYRDGVADQRVLVYDKEWWQNFESLVGFLNGYVLYHDERYAEAFLKTWEFVRDHFMNMEAGESRQLLQRDGSPIVPDLGNPWKGIYHTGRALAECLRRLSKL